MAMLGCDANAKEDVNISTWKTPNRHHEKIEINWLTPDFRLVVSNRRTTASWREDQADQTS
jgi:hypothetical protein